MRKKEAGLRQEHLYQPEQNIVRVRRSLPGYKLK